MLPAKTPLPGKGPRSLQEGGEGGPGGISAGTPSPRRSQLCQDGAWVMLAQGVQPHLLYLATCHLCSLPRKPPEASAPAFALPTYRNCPQPATSTFHDAKCDASHWLLSGPSSAQPTPPPTGPSATRLWALSTPALRCEHRPTPTGPSARRGAGSLPPIACPPRLLPQNLSNTAPLPRTCHTWRSHSLMVGAPGLPDPTVPPTSYVGMSSSWAPSPPGCDLNSCLSPESPRIVSL